MAMVQTQIDCNHSYCLIQRQYEGISLRLMRDVPSVEWLSNGLIRKNDREKKNDQVKRSRYTNPPAVGRTKTVHMKHQKLFMTTFRLRVQTWVA